MNEEMVRWYKDVDRRLRALETGQRAVQTSLRGGLTRYQPLDAEIDHPSVNVGAGQGNDTGIAMFDADGNQYFGVGAFNGDGVLVVYRGQVAILAPSGAQLLSMLDGVQYIPLIPCAWQVDSSASKDTVGRPTTTSASYVNVFRTYLPCLSGGLNTEIVAAPGAGNTMSWEITAEAFGSGAGEQVVHQETGITSTTAYTGPWSIPDTVLSPSADPIGQLLTLRLKILRSAGSTAVAIAPHLPAINWVA